ncbi:MAG TPA: hypothetical protein VJ898_00390 [Natrialbaceae archaeon]|nr:hypothetical protein [Natrialbaceae archaeon]
MDLDPRDEDLSWLRNRLRKAITHTYELEAGSAVHSDAFFSRTFMHRHTKFESFEAFRLACPSDGDELRDLQKIPEKELDAFVSDTTEFETWDDMKRSAAVSNVMDLVGGQMPPPRDD